ncbi:zinc finger protein 615-like [Thamnophis elegans]|uniref:zinc finger protein 615-like n=1 Tax=Thamnophis elegans TaxID=35005 RepID=UPI0013784506|nr:zinc finger protein 615-like [Thamnophis elegans]
MAALESAFSEEAMADINPALDRENLAATDNEGLATDQLTTTEKVALKNSVNAEAVWEYPWQSDKVVTNLSVPHQDGNISVKNEEANSQSSKQINNHDNQNKNLYFCDVRLKKDFQQPSLFAQHKNVFCPSKVLMQNKQLNWDQLEIGSPLVPDQNRQTKNCSIGDQCGENNQSLSYLSQYCKNILLKENSAWQHQNSQSEASSLISEACNQSTLVPVPLRAENIIEYIDEAVGPNPIQVTDQKTETKHLHICDQCGKEYEWLSELIQHQLFFGGEADRQCQLHMEGRNPSHLAPVPILFQGNNMCATFWETLQQKSRDHNTHAKIGKDFCRFSLPKRHTLPREELTRQNESKINKSSTLSFVPLVRRNTFADSCEMSNVNSMLTCSYTGKQHSDQCGRCYHCLCAQQHLDNFELKSDTDELFNLGAYCPKSLVPIPSLAEKIFSENSKIPIEQKNYAKNLNTFNCDKNDFQRHLLTKHHLHVPLGGEADILDQLKIQAGSLSRFQIERKIIESSESVKPQSNLTTNQGFQIKTECEKDFQWSSALTQHQVVNSGKVNWKQCPSKVDDQNDSSPDLMDLDQPAHLKTNQLTEKHKPYACGHCGKSFKWPSGLVRHEQTHYRTKLIKGKCTKLNKSYICGHCGKTFQWPELVQHKYMHSRKKLLRAKDTKPNKYYTRSQCGRSFQSLSQLAQHEHTHSRSKLVSRKLKPKPHICNQCGKGFTWPSDLARHQQTHSKKIILKGKGIKLKKYYTCSQCTKSFQRPSQLAQHEHTHSRSKLVRSKLKLKSHICNHCGKGFTWPSDLARHQQTHSKTIILKGKGIKPKKYYTRSQCTKSFQRPFQFTQHEHTHSRNKLVSSKLKLNKSCICDQCGKSFKWPSDLARHQQTHSKKIILKGKDIKLKKYHTCSQCTKSFQRPSQLAQHEHTHSRSKLAESSSPNPISVISVEKASCGLLTFLDINRLILKQY